MWHYRRLFGPSLAAALISLPAVVSHAQGQIGAIAGFTSTTFRGVNDINNRTGVIGGLSIVLPSGGAFTWQPELLLVSKGAKGTNSTPQGLKLNYLEVPVLLRLNLGSGSEITPHLYAGPYFGLQVDCKVQGISGKCDDVPGVSTHTVDVGGTFGGGVSLDLSGVVFTGGLRYSFGVSKVADFDVASVKESAKNGGFALYTGVALRLGSRK